MKGAILGICAAGAGGAYWYAGSGPDFDRVVHRPPMNVYAAFSALGPEGTMSYGHNERLGRRVSRRIEKTLGEALHYEILVADGRVLDVELNFAPGPDGQGTRMTAEFDVNAYAIGSTFENEAGIALALVPDAFFDNRFAHFMDEMVDDIEAGRPLRPLSLADAGIRPARDGGSSVHARRAIAERNRREAGAPMTRARPMVDPDRAANDYVNGRDAGP
jgi:hypothetical protein